MATVTRDKILSFLIGLVVLGFALLTLQRAEGAVGDPQRPVTLEQMLREISDGTAENEAEGVADDVGLVPLAMPCTMRRPRLALGVHRAWRHRFAAATLMGDPEQTMALIADLRETAPDHLSRWRIEIFLVEQSLRVADDSSALVYLTRARAISVPPACQADAAYFAALLADGPAEAAAHLDDAVRLDPGHWLAQEMLALRAVAGTGSDHASCEADAVRILRSAVQLGALARQDIQFQQLTRAIDALPESGRAALLRGMILRQTAQPDAARAAYLKGLEGLGATPCDRILARGLEGMLAATGGPE